MREHGMVKSSGTWLKRRFASLILIVAVLFAAVLGSFFFLNQSQSQTVDAEKCYVGVAFCGNTTAEARLLIDRVKSYTNLLVLQSGPVSRNETATNEICDYAVRTGLSIVVYFGDLNPRVLTNETSWRVAWVNSARQRWGERLLGVYYYDEPGGIWIDTDWSQFPRAFPSNSTYESVAERFIRGFKRDPGTVLLKNNSIPIFVSDYALYWFDYLSGYDVVLAEIGWNRTLPQDIALLRGAARMQNKDWGAIIGWKYTVPPYLDTGQNIYSQMVDAYRAGAKYIVVFNYPQLDGNAYGVMTDDHFEALEQFWNDVVNNSRVVRDSTAAEAALVLPRNYGWGMRNPEDHIWGFWGPDDKSTQVWTISRTLLDRYGLRLDIVYDDPNFPFEEQYSKVYYWNQTT
jgi:hypothetical protein